MGDRTTGYVGNTFVGFAAAGGDVGAAIDPLSMFMTSKSYCRLRAPSVCLPLGTFNTCCLENPNQFATQAWINSLTLADGIAMVVVPM
jgi:hypothetical protein